MRSQDWLCGCWHDRSSDNIDVDNFSFMVHMTNPTFRDVCKSMAHIVVEGLEHRSGETAGTLMPTGSSTAARQ